MPDDFPELIPTLALTPNQTHNRNSPDHIDLQQEKALHLYIWHLQKCCPYRQGRHSV